MSVFRQITRSYSNSVNGRNLSILLYPYYYIPCSGPVSSRVGELGEQHTLGLCGRLCQTQGQNRYSTPSSGRRHFVFIQGHAICFFIGRSRFVFIQKNAIFYTGRSHFVLYTGRRHFIFIREGAIFFTEKQTKWRHFVLHFSLISPLKFFLFKYVHFLYTELLLNPPLLDFKTVRIG